MQNFIWNSDRGDGTYVNPILYTDYSDPDVVRVGDDYYMTASSFCNTPALPVLHSKDLVNWEMISYALDTIPAPGFEVPQHGHGVWAPAIRYHEGKFMIFYPMPDEGIFMVQAEKAEGPWSAPVCVKEAKGWIDPCPFWDEDGKAYLVNAFAKSRAGIKSILHITPMKPDGTALLGEGVHVYDGHKTQPTIEGPKMYKKNGWYYIFAPAGSVQTGWETVLRSKNIYGPYEERIVLMQCSTRTNGPHQGAWVDTPYGEDWFVHFQDVGSAGRITHLEPMRWENDWPIIGLDDGEGFGTPVESWTKPKTKEASPIVSPADSDDFSGEKPGLQWQWNANYKKEWYRMEQPGMRLFAQKYEGPLCDAPHLYVQKWTAPEFSAEFTFDISALKDGDRVGMISYGRFYTALELRKEEDGVCLYRLTGTIGEKEEEEPLGWVGGKTVRMGMNVCADNTGRLFFPDVTGKMRPVGDRFGLTAGYWVGCKFGMYASHTGSREAGSLLAKNCQVSGRLMEES